MYYYNRKTSIKYIEYLKFQRLYDETFSLNEFRKVRNQKKEEQERRRQKSKEITRLRRNLVSARTALQEIKLSLIKAKEE
jgi:hypothetical protein